jgi:hypothetical protein
MTKDNEHKPITEEELTEYHELYETALSSIDTYGCTIPSAEARVSELEADRTLTLPNGTVVRAGDVLVSRGRSVAGVTTTEVIKVTSVGRETFLMVQIAWWSGDIETERGLVLGRNHNEPEDMWVDQCDWRPWSEVYPDRPVPGEDKQQ